MTTSANYRRTVLRLADEALRGFGGAECDRERAARLLRDWPCSVLLDADLKNELLARFSPAEPPNVPGRDWLPSAAEVASYNAAVAESLAVPAPVKTLPAKPRRWRDRDDQFWQVGDDELIALETERGPSRLFVVATVEELAELYGPLVEVPAPVKELPARPCTVCGTSCNYPICGVPAPVKAVQS